MISDYNVLTLFVPRLSHVVLNLGLHLSTVVNRGINVIPEAYPEIILF